MNRIFSLVKEKKVDILLTFLGVILLLVLVFLLKVPIVDREKEQTEKSLSGIIEGKRDKIATELLEKLEAKSIYVLDINTNNTIFLKNEKERLPLASLTKIMSSLVISEKLPSFTSVAITKESISLIGDNGLLIDEKWRLKDLLDFSLLTSSNDGIFALSSVLNAYEALEKNSTVDLMNEKAKELQLGDMIFFNETGLDLEDGGNGGYASAKDTANLISFIIKNKPDLLSVTAFPKIIVTSESNIKHLARNTNSLSEKIPFLMASKTGFTDFAGGNLAIVFEVGPQKPIVAVVMGSSYDGRFLDMEEIVESTFKYYSNLN